MRFERGGDGERDRGDGAGGDGDRHRAGDRDRDFAGAGDLHRDRDHAGDADANRDRPTFAARARLALAERWANLRHAAADAWQRWRALWRAKFAPHLHTRAFQLGVLLPLTVVAVAVLYYAWAVNRPLDFGDEVWVIAPGETLGIVADRLVAREVIGESVSLRLLARPGDLGRRVRSGAYRFPAGISMREFLRRVVTGAGQIGLKITFIEGWTFARMRAEIAAAPKLQHATAGLSWPEIMAELGAPGVHPEGRFFPDTYRYTAGQTDLSVYRQAYRLMQDKLAAAWESRAGSVPLGSADEALIIASIIEKESQVVAEQPRIAGVFYNRLRAGMRLQTDPTVIYGLGDKLRGKLRRKHLRVDTPYNTYTRHGLPPTPISLPGADALRAAVQPEATDAYYFVASGGGGAHHFSATLDQHNRAVRRYRARGG